MEIASPRGSELLLHLNHPPGSEALLHLNQTPVPRKQQLLASTYFFMLGVGCLFPSQGVISTLDFFQQNFRNFPVYFAFPAASYISACIITFLIVFFSHRFSVNARVAGSFTLLVIFLAALPIIAAFFSESKVGFWLCLIVLFFTGAFFTVANATVSGLGALFPAEYRARNTVGCGFAGILTNVIRAIILLALSSTSSRGEVLGVYIYYCIGIIILILCRSLHFAFIRSPYTKAVLDTDTIIKRESLDYIRSMTKDVILEDEEPESMAGKIRVSLLQLWDEFKEVKVLGTLMIILYLQSSMLFPGIMVAKKIPISEAWKDVLILFTYNLSDTLGKCLTVHRSLHSKKAIIVIVSCRFIFFIIFILSATSPDLPFISSIWFFFVSVALFGLTGGFVTGSLFVMIPENASLHKRETSGFLAVTCLNFGFSVGANLSVPLANSLRIR